MENETKIELVIICRYLLKIMSNPSLKNKTSNKNSYLVMNGLEKSHLFLKNYSSYNSESWKFLISILKEKYDEIQESIENDDIKTKKLSLLEIEIFCKLFELSESFASLLNALNSDDKQIQENFIVFNERIKGRTTISSHEVYSKKIEKFNFYKILTYPDITKLSLTTKEMRILEEFFNHNIAILKILCKIIKEFRDENLYFYNKYRHSRPIFIGLPVKYKEINGMSFALTRDDETKKTIPLFHSKISVDLYVNLAFTIILLQKDLIENRILSYERAGYKQPATKVYFTLSENAKQFFDQINAETSKTAVRTEITEQIEINLDPNLMDNFIKSCLAKQVSVKFGLNDTIEKLVSDL